MKKIINFWGKDGAVSAFSFTAAACMGMIDTDDEIFVRYIGFSESSMKFSQPYKRYFKILFGKETNINFENIVLQAEGSVSEKYHNDELLSLGCKQNEISMNIPNVINSGTNIGEIFFSENDIKPLFEGLPENEEITVINCGNPCNDGLAFTMIPKESAESKRKCRRYNVISGPCTSALYNISVPFPDIYNEKTFHDINIFDIPEIVRFMKEEGNKSDSDIFGTDSDFSEKNKQNIEFLEKEYRSVVSEKHDLSGLNPYTYAIHFTDYISVKKPTVSATFINMKTDGENFSEPDTVSDGFEENRRYDITSLLNALSVREIILNGDNYNDGRIYSFGCESADKYNANVLFDESAERAFFEFLLTALLVSGMVRTSFSEQCDVKSVEIAEKWAVKKKSFLGLFDFKSAPEKILKSYFENSQNTNFGNEMIKYINEFTGIYVCPVINLLMETDIVSEQSCILSGELRNISESILYFKKKYTSYQETEKNIKGLISGIYGISGEKTNGKISVFLDEYKRDFPLLSVGHSTVSEYFETILAYTMKKSKEFSGGVLI